MLSLIKRNKTFVGNVIALVGGVGFGRVIAIAAAPILARIFDPEHFGIAAQLVALAMVLNAISSLRYDAAIVLPDEHDLARSLSRLAFLILLGFGVAVLLVAVALVVLQPDVQFLLSLDKWLLLLPLAVILLGIISIFRRWMARQKKFKTMGFGVAANAANTAASRIGLGVVLGSTPGGLIAGYLIGVVTEALLLSRAMGWRMSELLWAKTETGVAAVAHRYRDFAVFSTPTALLKALSENLPILLLGTFFTPAIVGFYALAKRLIQAPVGIAARGISTVFMQLAIDKANAGRSILAAVVKMTLGLALVAFLPFLLLYLYGTEVFVLLLGERWEPAGQFTEVLTPFFLSMLLVAPAQTVYMVLERQRILLFLQTVRTIALAAAFLTAAQWELGATGTLWAFSITGVVTNLGVAGVALWLAWVTPPESIDRGVAGMKGGAKKPLDLD